MNPILSKIGIKDESFDLSSVRQLVEEQVLERPIDGNHGEIHPKSEDFVPEGVPFIMATDVNDGQIDYGNCNFITAKQADSLRKGFAKNGDVLLTHKATIGRTAIVRYDQHPYVMLTPQVTYYRVKDRARLSNRYLRHYFNSEFFQRTLHLWADSGSTRAYLGITEQQKLPVIVPPIGQQRKIAAILSAYDELIENNQRRIALLEKLAEEIYREWFVRLRFPGHEKVKRIKGIPEGWEVKELKEVADEVGKSTKAGSHLSERFYLPLDLLASKQMLPAGHDDYSEAQSSLVTFEKGDFLFGAMRPYQHKVAIAPFPGITRTTCFVVRPKSEYASAWLFLTLFQPSSIDYASLICNGSDRPYAVWNKGMERMKLLWPGEDLVKEYEAKARPILDSILSMYFVQRNLRASRDLLLPRLISGKLSVENLDIQFPPGMAEELAESPAAADA